MIRKIGLYFLSLWLLFILIFIITVKIPIYLKKDWVFIGLENLLKINIIPFLCFIAIIIGWISFSDFKHKVKGSTELPFKVESIENIDYEHLTFLTTYIVPLVCFNFISIRYLIVLLILLIIIGIIYIRTDLFYANPTLAILQFRIYKISGNFVKDGIRNNIILITRDKLQKDDLVKYIKLDNRIYYAKKQE
ncbi:anti-phage protein KwaA [Flavobacterium sp.]|uniref:anti-phage protein KwaA n=1 Tax=Flavobacterium sp. TaxID=239 RepID=UPI002639CC78|nr:anti-phage protein KwaA [Flavobacterium sp.]